MSISRIDATQLEQRNARKTVEGLNVEAGLVEAGELLGGMHQIESLGN